MFLEMESEGMGNRLFIWLGGGRDHALRRGGLISNGSWNITIVPFFDVAAT